VTPFGFPPKLELRGNVRTQLFSFLLFSETSFGCHSSGSFSVHEEFYGTNEQGVFIISDQCQENKKVIFPAF